MPQPVQFHKSLNLFCLVFLTPEFSLAGYLLQQSNMFPLFLYNLLHRISSFISNKFVMSQLKTCEVRCVIYNPIINILKFKTVMLICKCWFIQKSYLYTKEIRLSLVYVVTSICHIMVTTLAEIQVFQANLPTRKWK